MYVCMYVRMYVDMCVSLFNNRVTCNDACHGLQLQLSVQSIPTYAYRYINNRLTWYPYLINNRLTWYPYLINNRLTCNDACHGLQLQLSAATTSTYIHTYIRIQSYIQYNKSYIRHISTPYKYRNTSQISTMYRTYFDFLFLDISYLFLFLKYQPKYAKIRAHCMHVCINTRIYVCIVRLTCHDACHGLQLQLSIAAVSEHPCVLGQQRFEPIVCIIVHRGRLDGIPPTSESAVGCWHDQRLLCGTAAAIESQALRCMVV